MEKIAQIVEVLEFMKTMLHSIVHDTIKISKETLFDIQTCLQNAQDKIDFLQLES